MIDHVVIVIIGVMVWLTFKVRHDHEKARILVESDRKRNEAIECSMLVKQSAQNHELEIIKETSNTKCLIDEKLTSDATCLNEKATSSNTSNDSIFDDEQLNEPCYSMATLRIASLKKNKTKCLNGFNMVDSKKNTFDYEKEASVSDGDNFKKVQPCLRSQFYFSKDNINEINHTQVRGNDSGIEKSYQSNDNNNYW